MELSLVIVVLFTIILAAIIANALQALVRLWLIGRAANKFPGEKKHWFWGTTHLFPGFNENGLAFSRAMAAKYPTAYREWHGPFTPNIILTHPSAAKVILTTSEPKSHEFGLQKFGKYWLGDGLLLTSGAKWSRNRRLLSPAFHFEILKSYSVVQNEAATSCLDKFKKFAKSGEPIDLYSTISLLTFEIILRCAMSYGDDVQKSTDREKHPYLTAIKELARLWSLRALNPWLLNDFIYFKLTSNGKLFLENSQRVHAIDEQVINKRIKDMQEKTNGTCESSCVKSQSGEGDEIEESDLRGQKQRLDLLDILLAAKDSDGRGLTFKEIRDEVDTFLFAGYDTAAVAITWSLYALASNVTYQRKCQEEIDTILDAKEKEEVTWNDLPNFHMLTMCVKEALRMYPPVVKTRRQLSRDMVIDNHLVKAGTQVVTDIYKIHHNPTVWDEPTTYRPERFLPENIAKMDSFSFIPFSAGPRNCIGQHFSLQEIKIVVARILRRFNIEIVPDMPPQRVVHIIMKAKGGVYVRVTERQK